jgi:hypothetical protein
VVLTYGDIIEHYFLSINNAHKRGLFEEVLEYTKYIKLHRQGEIDT